MSKKHWIITLALASSVMLPVSGCSKKDRSSKPVTKEGTIKSIDKANRTAVVTIMDKLGQLQDMDGKFTHETVITINGKPAELGDIKPGDTADVTVVRKGEGLNVELIATRVAIKREGPGESKPAG
jgi:hypothetical protein